MTCPRSPSRFKSHDYPVTGGEYRVCRWCGKRAKASQWSKRQKPVATLGPGRTPGPRLEWGR